MQKLNKIINIGIIGAGFAAHCRCNALREVSKEKFTIKGVYDINPKNSIAFSKEYSIKQYVNIEDVYNDKDIDTICVCTPSKYHYEIIKSALDYDKNIICEYPLVVKYEDAEELIRISNSKGLFVHVGQTMNYDADKELINANASKLGKLLMGYKFVSFKDIGSWFTTDGYEGIANWYTNSEYTGGWIITTSYHGIQLFRNVFGEVISIFGIDSSVKNVGSSSIIMKHENGASSVVQWELPTPGRSFNRTIICGTNGSIEVNEDRYYIKTYYLEESGNLLDEESAFRNVFRQDTLSLLKELTGLKDSNLENLDMLRNLKVTIYANESAINGKAIKITY